MEMKGNKPQTFEESMDICDVKMITIKVGSFNGEVLVKDLEIVICEGRSLCLLLTMSLLYSIC